MQSQNTSTGEGSVNKLNSVRKNKPALFGSIYGLIDRLIEGHQNVSCTLKTTHKFERKWVSFSWLISKLS